MVRNSPPKNFSDLWNEALGRWSFTQVENRHQNAKRAEALIQLQRGRPRTLNLQEAEAPASSPAVAWPVGIKMSTNNEYLRVEDISLKKIYVNGAKKKVQTAQIGKISEISAILERNPLGKSLKWMWWRNKWDVSNRKAQDLLWRIRLNSLLTGSRLIY